MVVDRGWHVTLDVSAVQVDDYVAPHFKKAIVKLCGDEVDFVQKLGAETPQAAQNRFALLLQELLAPSNLGSLDADVHRRFVNALRLVREAVEACKTIKPPPDKDEIHGYAERIFTQKWFTDLIQVSRDDDQIDNRSLAEMCNHLKALGFLRVAEAIRHIGQARYSTLGVNLRSRGKNGQHLRKNLKNAKAKQALRKKGSASDADDEGDAPNVARKLQPELDAAQRNSRTRRADWKFRSRVRAAIKIDENASAEFVQTAYKQLRRDAGKAGAARVVDAIVVLRQDDSLEDAEIQAFYARLAPADLVELAKIDDAPGAVVVASELFVQAGAKLEELAGALLNAHEAQWPALLAAVENAARRYGVYASLPQTGGIESDVINRSFDLLHDFAQQLSVRGLDAQRLSAIAEPLARLGIQISLEEEGELAPPQLSANFAELAAYMESVSTMLASYRDRLRDGVAGAHTLGHFIEERVQRLSEVDPLLLAQLAPRLFALSSEILQADPSAQPSLRTLQHGVKAVLARLKAHSLAAITDAAALVINHVSSRTIADAVIEVTRHVETYRQCERLLGTEEKAPLGKAVQAFESAFAASLELRRHPDLAAADGEMLDDVVSPLDEATLAALDNALSQLRIEAGRADIAAERAMREAAKGYSAHVTQAMQKIFALDFAGALESLNEAAQVARVVEQSPGRFPHSRLLMTHVIGDMSEGERQGLRIAMMSPDFRNLAGAFAGGVLRRPRRQFIAPGLTLRELVEGVAQELAKLNDVVGLRPLEPQEVSPATRKTLARAFSIQIGKAGNVGTTHGLLGNLARAQVNRRLAEGAIEYLENHQINVDRAKPGLVRQNRLDHLRSAESLREIVSIFLRDPALRLPDGAVFTLEGAVIYTEVLPVMQASGNIGVACKYRIQHATHTVELNWEYDVGAGAAVVHGPVRYAYVLKPAQPVARPALPQPAPQPMVRETRRDAIARGPQAQRVFEVRANLHAMATRGAKPQSVIKQIILLRDTMRNTMGKGKRWLIRGWLPKFSRSTEVTEAQTLDQFRETAGGVLVGMKREDLLALADNLTRASQVASRTQAENLAIFNELGRAVAGRLEDLHREEQQILSAQNLQAQELRHAAQHDELTAAAAHRSADFNAAVASLVDAVLSNPPDPAEVRSLHAEALQAARHVRAEAAGDPHAQRRLVVAAVEGDLESFHGQLRAWLDCLGKDEVVAIHQAHINSNPHLEILRAVDDLLRDDELEVTVTSSPTPTRSIYSPASARKREEPRRGIEISDHAPAVKTFEKPEFESDARSDGGDKSADKSADEANSLEIPGFVSAFVATRQSGEEYSSDDEDDSPRASSTPASASESPPIPPTPRQESARQFAVAKDKLLIAARGNQVPDVDVALNVIDAGMALKAHALNFGPSEQQEYEDWKLKHLPDIRQALIESLPFFECEGLKVDELDLMQRMLSDLGVRFNLPVSVSRPDASLVAAVSAWQAPTSSTVVEYRGVSSNSGTSPHSSGKPPADGT